VKYGASPGKQQPTAALPQCNVIYDTVGNVFNSEPVRESPPGLAAWRALNHKHKATYVPHGPVPKSILTDSY